MNRDRDRLRNLFKTLWINVLGKSLNCHYICYMMSCRRYFLLLFFSVASVVSGQYTKEFKRIFFDAEYLYQTGFYEEAFNRYKNLLTLDPGNSNILFHCGACCLNIPGMQDQAILYMKEAAEGVNPSYRGRSHKESGAPVLTYFSLGKAYHLDNQFEAAIRNYEKYLEAGTDEDPMQLEYAQLATLTHQI